MATHFVYWVVDTVDSPAEFHTDANKAWMARGALPCVRGYYNDQANISTLMTDDNFRLYTIDELTPISQDLLGYDYFAGRESLISEEGQFLVETRIGDAEDAARLDADSYEYTDNQISVEAVVESFSDTGSSDIIHSKYRYYFTYMPENEYVPYRFVKSELVESW